MLKSSLKKSETDLLVKLKAELDNARKHGDKLAIELAEAAMNDCLDRL